VVRTNVSTDVTIEEWQRVADACDYATFFHTPLWHRAVESLYDDARVDARMVRFDDGRSAVLPVLVRSIYRGLIHRYESSPAGCYGGWISGDDLGAEHIAALSRTITGYNGDLAWRLNPFDPAYAELSALATDEDTTEVLVLDRFADEEALRRNYRHSVRKQINKADRFGMQVRPAREWREWETYYGIYQESLRRWGDAATSRYPIEFFRGLFDAKSDQVCLWLVTSPDEIVGGNLNFYQGRHCVEWHAVFLDEYFRRGVRNFLVHQLILDAKNRGFAVYDFNPSGGNEGTRRFKRNFGTECIPTGVVVRKRFNRARTLLGRISGVLRSRSW
jgi:CelD/BcsL family acetyltransferase involved in cellulose biosynthesis